MQWLDIFGIVKTSTFIWWYPGVDMYCNIKISFMLHRLFRGYLTIGYTARYTWLYSHFLNSHVFMAILPIYSTTCALSIGAFRGPSIHPIPSTFAFEHLSLYIQKHLSIQKHSKAFNSRPLVAVKAVN